MRTFSKPGWIFSPRLDLMFFGLPIVIALGVFHVVPQGFDVRTLMLWFIVGHLLCDFGHTYATALPVYAGNAPFAKALRWAPIAVFAGAYFWIKHSPNTFYVLGAYATLFHVVRQQYGWIVLSRRRGGEPAEGFDDKFDRAMLYNFSVIPILLWHAGYSLVPLRYFSENDMPFRVAEFWIPTLLGVHWAINGLYVARQIQLFALRTPLNAAKYFLLFATWCWFYLGLLYSQAAWQFWLMTTLMHGITYHGHILATAKTRKTGSWLSTAVYLGVIVGLGYVYYLGGVNKVGSPNRVAIEAALWTVALSHILFDSIIWRSNLPAFLLATKPAPLRSGIGTPEECRAG